MEKHLEEIKSPLRILRELSGMNQSDFALLLHCDKSTISGIETGMVPLTDDIVKKMVNLAMNTENIIEKQNEFVDKLKKDLLVKFYKEVK